jgi:phage terminase Nu1 subunit (DNA packaging protein)
MTGHTRDTVRKRLRDLRPEDEVGPYGARMYDSAEALAAIYSGAPAGDLDLAQERAKLAAKQAERVALDVKRLRAELLPVADVTNAWAALAEHFEAELATLPAALAHAAMGAMSVNEIEQTTRVVVNDLLTRLSKLEDFPE